MESVSAQALRCLQLIVMLHIRVLLNPGISVLYVTIPLIFWTFIRWRLVKKPSRKEFNVKSQMFIKTTGKAEEREDKR